MKEFIYKLSVNVGDGEKSIEAIRRSMLELEKRIDILKEKSKEGVNFRIGQPNELKVAQAELAKLQQTLTDLGGASVSVAQVESNVTELGGAIVGLTGQYAGLNTAIAGSNQVMSEQEFVNEALAASTKDVSKAIDEQTKSVEKLNETAASDIEVDVKADSVKDLNETTNSSVASVAKLRKEVISLQTELENTEVGSEKYKELEARLVDTSSRLAETKDRFDDLSDSVRVNILFSGMKLEPSMVQKHT